MPNGKKVSKLNLFCDPLLKLSELWMCNYLHFRIWSWIDKYWRLCSGKAALVPIAFSIALHTMPCKKTKSNQINKCRAKWPEPQSSLDNSYYSKNWSIVIKAIQFTPETVRKGLKNGNKKRLTGWKSNVDHHLHRIWWFMTHLTEEVRRLSTSGSASCLLSPAKWKIKP